ncbi:MAG: glycosyltransferase, partial [Deltaproteobacteria bacterium]|nr:glycosyltransferase [Deltaproteobacteria bacterium]
MTRALFVTWDSPETTYLESLFLPLFAAMRPHGVTVDVLQFTWGGALGRRRAAADRLGIAYRASLVRSGGSVGTAEVLLRGPSAIAESRFDVLYPRSLVPVAIALRARPRRLVFDADGLVADERIDFAGWSPNGPRTRLFRRFERRGVQRADRVITRTARAREILLSRAGVAPDRVVVIPNGKDPEVFSPGTAAERLAFRRAHGIPDDAPWAIYAGSIGPQYHLDEMLAFHRHARAIRPDARLTLLTRVPLRIAQPGVEVVACDTEEVPAWLRAADIGLAWRTPTFSTAGVC